jgi:trigger factor
VQPRVTPVSADPAKDLEFTLEVELLPEIALPDFGTLELKRLKAEAAAETIDQSVAELARRNREFVELSDEQLGGRGAEKGEVVRLDYRGRIDGAEFAGGRGTDVEVEVAGSGFAPGFTEQIEGIRPGETRTITVTFPEGYGNAELAGKVAEFEIAAKAVKQVLVPAVDDELARKLGFESLDELREVVRTQIQREYDQLSRLRLKRELLDRLDGMVSFTLPEAMVEGEFGQIWARLEADRKEDRLDEEDRNKDEAALRAEYRAIAERRVRLGLLLAEIGRSNTIVVSADEMTRAVRAEAARYPGREAQVMEFFRKNPAAAETLRGPIFEEKVVDYVFELAKMSEEVVPPEELVRQAEGR